MVLNQLFNQQQTNQLRDHSVTALFLFGSQAIHCAGPLSDTDIGVLLTKPVDPDRQLAETVELELLLAKMLPDYKRLEVTILNTAPVGLQIDALARSKLLVEIDPSAVADFREYVMRRAGDLGPFLRAFRTERLKSSYA